MESSFAASFAGVHSCTLEISFLHQPDTQDNAHSHSRNLTLGISWWYGRKLNMGKKSFIFRYLPLPKQWPCLHSCFPHLHPFLCRYTGAFLCTNYMALQLARRMSNYKKKKRKKKKKEKKKSVNQWNTLQLFVPFDILYWQTLLLR